MLQHTRRHFLQSAASFSAVAACSTSSAWAAAPEPRPAPVPPGYFLVQDLATYNTSRFGALSTRAEAVERFTQVAGRLDALEFATLFYDDHDMRAHETIAQEARRRKIDLWNSTFRLTSKVRAFGAVRPEFLAHAMEPDGRIVPAVGGEKDSRPQPLFDVLNPEAVEWFLDAYRRRYFEPMKGLLSGLFINEDCLAYLGTPANDRRYDYWRTPVYSPRVLKLWQGYCQAHGVAHEGRPVDKFPVHDPALVAAGGGQTDYFPGWNVPAKIQPGQRFVDLPRAEGVWRHWYDFLCEQFLHNWIGRLAALAQEINRGESIWRGTLYFGLHHWSLPYEAIRNPEFTVPKPHRWGAWGRQRGVDLPRLAAHPAIDIVVCETYPPVAANLEGFIAEYDRITRAAGKTYGVMLHRDDKWPLKVEEEAQRWALINKYRPTVITRYPLKRMLRDDEFYSPAGEAAFEAGLADYRRGGR